MTKAKVRGKEYLETPGTRGAVGGGIKKISTSRLKMKLKFCIILNNQNHIFARGEEI